MKEWTVESTVKCQTFVALQHNRTSLLTEDPQPEENGHGVTWLMGKQ